MREEDSHKLYLLGTGDQAVMAEVFDAHALRVKQYIRNRMGKEVNADELTHEAFVRMYKHARWSPRFYRRFDTITQFLLVLTAGVVGDYLRRRQREEKHQEALKNVPVVHVPPTDARVLGNEIVGVVKKGLWGLSKKARVCVELLFFHGYSVEETAVLTGTPPRTVRTYLQRARAQLRPLLGQYRKGGRV